MSTTVVAMQRATYTAREVAALFGVSAHTVYRQCREGVFPVKPIPGLGERVIFSRAEVNDRLGIQPEPAP